MVFRGKANTPGPIHSQPSDPVPPKHIDDQTPGLHVRPGGPARRDATNALRPRRGRERWLQTIAALAHPDVGRVDGKREDVEDDLVRPRRGDVRDLGTAGDLLRLALAIDQDLFHVSTRLS